MINNNKLKKEDLEIIDFDIKGSMVKFFLGKNGNQYGDDWNDTPYEHNAGRVYDRFVKDTLVLTFNFDDLVLEPCSGELNSSYSKEDMIKRLVPCVIVIPQRIAEDIWQDSFSYWMNHPDIIKYYFGDNI